MLVHTDDSSEEEPGLADSETLGLVIREATGEAEEEHTREQDSPGCRRPSCLNSRLGLACLDNGLVRVVPTLSLSLLAVQL